MNEQMLAAALRRLDVPEYKQDHTRFGNVTWLLTNLRQRNLLAPDYSAVMRALLAIACARNLLKKSEVRDIEQHLETVEATSAATFTIPPVKKPELHPYQKAVLQALEAPGAERQTFHIRAGAGKAVR